MAVEIWDSLVAEAQFATELALTGLRRLCSVPTEPDIGGGRRSSDRNYSLHVGMYSYSSGLERLCKLAIACRQQHYVWIIKIGRDLGSKGFNHGRSLSRSVVGDAAKPVRVCPG